MPRKGGMSVNRLNDSQMKLAASNYEPSSTNNGTNKGLRGPGTAA